MVVKLDSQPLPTFTEVRDKEWISYGQENDFPLYLIDLYNKSAKHNAIINGKTNYVLGAGWKIENKDNLDVTKTEILLKSANPYESLNEVSRKLINDFEIYNGIALEVIWNKSGKGLPTFMHKDFGNVRSNIDCTQFFYTKKWFKTSADGTRRKNKDAEEEEDYTEYEPYNPNKRKGKQLLYIKGYRPNLDVYPLPNYIGALKYIDVDTEIANYHYHNLKNGFAATFMIKFFNGIPSLEEQKKIEKQIKEKVTGTNKSGSFMINFSDGKDSSCEIEVIPLSESDDQFKLLNETVQQEIFSGHQVSSPMLFGIKTEGQLGGRSEIIEANELFQNTYVRPRQMFIEEIFNSILKDLNLVGEIKLGQLEPIGIDYTENNRWNILTDEEKREKSGLPKVEKAIASLSDKLSVLPPYLLAKVMEKLTNDEIRGLVDLPSASVTLPAPQTESTFAFKKENLVIDHILWTLENCGEKKSDYEILESLPLSGNFDFAAKEKELFAKKSDYISKLNGNDRALIDLLDKDNLMPAEELAKTLKITVKEVQNSLRRLEKNNLISSKENKDGLMVRIPKPKAIDILEKGGAKTEEIFVKYSYEWLPGFSDRDINTSRDFCKQLLKKDKLYTRAEIEKLNNEMGLNVWESRGGWYTEPGTETHLPFCRHVWVQQLVRKF